jgi:hypothetical protein
MECKVYADCSSRSVLDVPDMNDAFTHLSSPPQTFLQHLLCSGSHSGWQKKWKNQPDLVLVLKLLQFDRKKSLGYNIDLNYLRRKDSKKLDFS